MSLGGKPVIALVPARGGSKGVSRKNLRVIAGQSLVEFTLHAATGAERVDSVYLSSDAEDILAVGRILGVGLIMRPEKYASDTASATDVVRHFVGELPKNIVSRDPYIVYLQPSSPLRSAHHIDSAVIEMEKRQEHALMSVVELVKSPFKSFLIDSYGRLQSLFDEKLSNSRRQDLPKAYIPNGAIYIFRLSDFLARDGFPSNGSLPFVMTEEESIDIDTEEDIRYLEQYFGEKHG